MADKAGEERKGRSLPVRVEDVVAGNKPAVARALASLEREPMPAEVCALLDELHQTGRAQVIGLTGPPGVGKSTLSASLIAGWRQRGRSVGVLAVDPSSRKSGGALLGDRSRMPTDPEDQGIFIRSLAARRRLGGLADLIVPAMTVMRAAYDIVLIETVGIGQSETDVGDVADTVVFCVQPGSGDSLQFMKAGIMEIPDILVVTKADMGAVADRAAGDLDSAVALAAAENAWRIPILTLSATTGTGLDALISAISEHEAHLAESGEAERRERKRLSVWLRQTIAERCGSLGLAYLEDEIKAAEAGERPFAAAARLMAEVERRWQTVGKPGERD